MLDSIYIGMTGLMGYSKGLRVIANNTANLNTPGFKGSSLQFGDLVSGGGQTDGSGINELGQGLTTYATSFDFSQGELRQTGNDLDLAVDGQGMFMLKDTDGNMRYSRDGEFTFDKDGFLVSRSSGAKVLGHDQNGALSEISLAGLRSHAASATTTVVFRGNLPNTRSSQTLTDIKVIDALGAEHPLRLEFTNENSTAPGQWKVSVMDGATEVGSGTLTFTGDGVLTSDGKVSFTYKPAGTAEIPLTLDFSADVTSNSGDSSLVMISQDGYGAGSLTKATFDADGVLNLAYSNGQTTKGPGLALARFDSAADVTAAGDNTFQAVDASRWETGSAGAGAFGSIRSGVVELSNVDLSSEFSDLVIMQRGYQASSQVVSTANDMIQELFSLKGR